MAKQVTVEKLQSFIEAVEFAADLENPDDWVPTQRQWKKIRSMIDALEETVAAPVHVPPPLQYASPAPMQYREPMPVQFAAPSAFDNVQHPVNVPRGVPMATGDGGTLANPVATPNLDTSNGHYDSSFA